ncbi:hypothetical protein ACWGH2_24385 [Streptomyces sp. NPDC054871]
MQQRIKNSTYIDSPLRSGHTKRQMAGRASIQLLRKRVILVAHSRRSNQSSPDDDLWSINGYENLG